MTMNNEWVHPELVTLPTTKTAVNKEEKLSNYESENHL